MAATRSWYRAGVVIATKVPRFRSPIKFMIIALYVREQGKLEFHCAINDTTPGHNRLVESQTDVLQSLGLVVVEKYYTEDAWARQMPVAQTKADDQELLYDTAIGVALAWVKLSPAVRKRDMQAMKAVSPALYNLAKRLMEMPGCRQVT